jgi:hypothetical protein
MALVSSRAHLHTMDLTNPRKVFNILGQQVETLVNSVQRSGNHVVVFDARRLSSGVYFYKLEVGKFAQVMKMKLLK